MVEQADPSSSFLLCPRLAGDKLVEDGEGSTEKTPARTRTTYAEKCSRYGYVSAERRGKRKCNVDHSGYWKCCDRSVDGGPRSSQQRLGSVDSRYQTGLGRGRGRACPLVQRCACRSRSGP
jgi:hypothetical protein